MKKQQIVPRKRDTQLAFQGNVGEQVSAFDSETAAVLEMVTPKDEHRLLYMLVGMIALAIGLSAVVKLDRVVTGSGTVTSVGGQLYVSPLDRAIVREVLVKTGDVVKKGQPLAKLDSTFTQADLTQLQQRFASDTAEVERRVAELAGKPYVPKNVDAYSSRQVSIFNQRKEEYRASLSDFDARIESARAAVRQYQQDIQNYDKRLQLASKNEQTNLYLQRNGYVTQTAAMAATDSRVEISRLRSDSENQYLANSHTLESLAAQRAAYVQKWRSDLGLELVTAQNDLDLTRNSLSKAEKMNELVSLDSPQDAIVLSIAKISQGSIADTTSTTGALQQSLFTLVPLSSPLEAEMHINTNDIGFIQVGDKVQIKLDAYSFLRHGTVTGVLKTISPSSFTLDDATNSPVNPYYKARVEIIDSHLRNVPDDFRLTPGMTLSADVLVGRRTILSYLVEGALRTSSEAMREPN